MNKKNIVKLSLFTLILAFIAIGTIAVAKVMNKEKPVVITDKAVVMAPIWFEYTGKPNDPQEMEDNTNYQPVLDEYGNPTEPSCTGGHLLCAVKVTPDDNEPSIPNQADLEEVLENNDGNPNNPEIRYKP